MQRLKYIALKRVFHHATSLFPCWSMIRKEWLFCGSSSGIWLKIHTFAAINWNLTYKTSRHYIKYGNINFSIQAQNQHFLYKKAEGCSSDWYSYGSTKLRHHTSTNEKSLPRTHSAGISFFTRWLSERPSTPLRRSTVSPSSDIADIAFRQLPLAYRHLPTHISWSSPLRFR